jgi:hypothetical protein
MNGYSKSLERQMAFYGVLSLWIVEIWGCRTSICHYQRSLSPPAWNASVDVNCGNGNTIPAFAQLARMGAARIQIENFDG